MIELTFKADSFEGLKALMKEFVAEPNSQMSAQGFAAQRMIQEPTAQVMAPVTISPSAQIQVPVAPTAPTTYTYEGLAVACSKLVAEKRMDAVQSVFAQFGVQNLMAIPKERLPEVATALRAVGAQV